MIRRLLLRRLAVVAPVLMLALASTGGTASAHEDHAGGPPEPFDVVCEGVEYTIVGADGKWAAAIDRDSRTVFIPKYFEFTVTGYDAAGNELFTETETMAQGNGNAHKNQQTVTCTFGGTETDPDTGDVFEFSGTAVVVRRP